MGIRLDSTEIGVIFFVDGFNVGEFVDVEFVAVEVGDDLDAVDCGDVDH